MMVTTSLSFRRGAGETEKDETLNQLSVDQGCGSSKVLDFNHVQPIHYHHSLDQIPLQIDVPYYA